MLETEPVVTIEFETRFRRAKLAPGRAAGVVATAYGRFRLGRENRIADRAPHVLSMGGPPPRDKDSRRRSEGRIGHAEQGCIAGAAFGGFDASFATNARKTRAG